MKKINQTIFAYFVLGLSIGLWITLGLIFVFSTITGIEDEFIYDFFLDKTFKIASKQYEKSDIVNSIAETCSLYESNLSKVICVHRIVNDNYKFVKHNESKFANNLRESPEEFFEEGGVCRDFSVLLKSTLDVMNIKSEFVFIPEHVYNRVFVDDEIFIIDGDEFYEEEK